MSEAGLVYLEDVWVNVLTFFYLLRMWAATVHSELPVKWQLKEHIYTVQDVDKLHLIGQRRQISIHPLHIK